MVLRHRADKFGIQLDAEGFADVGAVFEVVDNRYNGAYTYDDLITVATHPGSDGKLRFELKGMRIRARYGHSRVAAVTYPPATPPDVLFHGTTQGALGLIRTDGLKAMSRQYVHLSTTESRATTVAARRGRPVILVIRAADAAEAGTVFYHPEDEHYLAEHIPPEFIDFP